jgi:hypothetical protein
MLNFEALDGRDITNNGGHGCDQQQPPIRRLSSFNSPSYFHSLSFIATDSAIRRGVCPQIRGVYASVQGTAQGSYLDPNPCESLSALTRVK